MTAKGYTSALKVALLLGQEGYAALSVNQAVQMSDGLIEAAEQWIDAYTGRSWLTGGTVTAERHPIENARVWLKNRPITAVSAIRIGGRFETLSLLTVTTDYVVEPTRGLITFRAYSSSEVEVDYTVPQTVPADVAEAAGLIVAGWLSGTAGIAGVGGGSSIKSWSVDGESITYRDPSVASGSRSLAGVPDAAANLLAHYRRPVLA